MVGRIQAPNARRHGCVVDALASSSGVVITPLFLARQRRAGGGPVVLYCQPVWSRIALATSVLRAPVPSPPAGLSISDRQILEKHGLEFLDHGHIFRIGTVEYSLAVLLLGSVPKPVGSGRRFVRGVIFSDEGV
jgi:hypothetical protein